MGALGRAAARTIRKSAPRGVLGSAGSLALDSAPITSSGIAVKLDFAATYPKHTTLLVAIAACLVLLKLYALLGRYRPGKWQRPAADALVSYSSSPGAPFFTTDPAAEAPVQVAKTDVAALESTTLPLFQLAVVRFPDKPALKVEAGGAGGGWTTHTWREYYVECEKVAASLIALGFEQHERVNIAASTRHSGSWRKWGASSRVAPLPAFTPPTSPMRACTWHGTRTHGSSSLRTSRS